MKKINIIFNKKDALLKVKDESMTITTSDNELIKIPYSSIKTYKYDEEEEILTISRHGDTSIKFEVQYDKVLFDNLDNLSNTSNHQKQAQLNKIGWIGSIILFGVLVIVFLVLPSGGSKEYLNAKIKGCPNITLKEGLENLKSFYNRYNVYFTYKIESGKSTGGEEITYLYLNNMETLYDYNVYVPLELNDGVVSFSYVFRNGTVERGVVGGSASIEAALCGNYN